MLATSLSGRLAGPLMRCLCVMLTALGASAALGALAARAAVPNSLGLAQRTAEEFWGNAPCAGQVAVQWQLNSPPAAIPGTEVEAWVNFQTPGGQLDFAASPSTYTQCTVFISQIVWPSYATTVQAYPQFCQMMVHEYGHFEGYADSTTYPSTDIRYPILTEANLPAVCRYELYSGTGASAFQRSSTATARAGAIHVERRCFEVRCGALIRHAKPHKL